MAGIISYGAYIPFYRLPRNIIGKIWGQRVLPGERAVANYDEDPISMSVAAGIDCLKGTDPKTVDGLFLATTTSPYKERRNSTIVSAALDLRRETRQADFTNCLTAGTAATLSALDAVKAGSAKSIMITAADMRLGAPAGDNEQAFGDGGAALLLGTEKVVAEIEGSYTLSDDFVDNWRAHDDTYVRSWEERFSMDEGYLKIPPEAVTRVMEKCGLTPRDFAKVCFYGPTVRRHTALGKAMGFAPDQIQDPLLETVGNTGAALSLMILVAALEEAKPGDRILLVSWGNGSDAIVFKVTEEIKNLTDRRGIKRHLVTSGTLDNYERYLRWRGLITLEAAARPAKKPVSLSSLWRERMSALGLYGVKCKNCGTPQMMLDFASSRPRVCLECHAKDNFEPYRFADKRGKLTTFSHDHLVVSNNPPSTMAVVDFEGGGRGAFEMTDRDPGECKVGMDVEMTFRKIFFDKGIHNYFWKCKPIRD